MRLSLVFMFLPVLACSSEAVSPPPVPPVNWRSFDAHAAAPSVSTGPTAKERAVAEAYIAAVASPQLKGLASLLDDGAHCTFPGRDDVRGRDQVVRAHEVLFGAFDDRKIAAARVWRTPSTQMLEWTMSGVQARDWNGVPAKRKSAVIHGITLLWTQDDGTITDAHIYFDIALARAQLGAGPKELVDLPPPPWPARPLEVVESTSSPEEGRNVMAVRGALDALENNSEPGFLSVMADDVETYTLERAEPVRGKDEARAYFRSMRKGIGQLDTIVEGAWGISSFVIVEYLVSGEQVGPIGWIPFARDRVIRLHVVDVAEMRDGRVARIWRFDNRGALLPIPAGASGS